MALPQSSQPPLPRWARVLDALCIVFAAAAIIVAISGGFRLRAGGIWIGVTTPYPLLLWALLIGIGRHVAAPQQPLLREGPRRVLVWSRSAAVRDATRAVVGTRLVVFFIGYLAVFMFGYAEGRPPVRHFDQRTDQPARAVGRRLVSGYRHERLSPHAGRHGHPAERRLLSGVPDARPWIRTTAGRPHAQLCAGWHGDLARRLLGMRSSTCMGSREMRLETTRRAMRSGCSPHTRSRCSSARSILSRCFCSAWSERSITSRNSSSAAPPAGACSSG